MNLKPLLPCPFCGGKADFVPSDKHSNGFGFVMCLTDWCCARTRLSCTPDFLWNKRATQGSFLDCAADKGGAQ